MSARRYWNILRIRFLGKRCEKRYCSKTHTRTRAHSSQVSEERGLSDIVFVSLSKSNELKVSFYVSLAWWRCAGPATGPGRPRGPPRRPRPRPPAPRGAARGERAQKGDYILVITYTVTRISRCKFAQSQESVQAESCGTRCRIAVCGLVLAAPDPEPERGGE